MIRALIDPSPDSLMAKRLTDRLGREGARRVISAVCRKFTNVELAALAARREAWSRPKQLPPPHWRSWGNLTSRGWGKTDACLNLITREIQAGRSRTLIMAAQNLTKTEAVQVEGLLRAAPPWFRPIYRPSDFLLEYPNGARAFAYTPEVPEAIRSENADLAWKSELQSWPKPSREEAYSNFAFATRVNGSRHIWDATPKKSHPILKRLLARAEKHPDKHFVVRGAIFENPHIDKAALLEMLEEYGGTQKGKEELLGEMLGDEDAIFRQEWFDASRYRGLPDRYKRRARYHDPAITSDARHSDSTGIFDMGLGFDDQIYAIKNHSGKHRAEDWATASIEAYVKDDLDLLWCETNRGGDSHAALLRVVARSKGLELRELAKDEVPVRRTGVVNFRGVNTKRQKVVRAEGAATLCEKKRVTMAKGLESFEEKLCGFDGSEGASDDDIDAFVHGCHDLAGLSGDIRDNRAAFTGITAMSEALVTAGAIATNLAAMFGGGNAGRI